MEDELSWLDSRRASGTSWQPQASPAWAWHFMSRKRMTVLQGLGFLDYVYAGGPRGGDDFGASGWVMVTQRWSLPSGRIGWRGMFTPEAAAWGDEGYPELFQVGEMLDGMPITDRQHPHDAFMELAFNYEGRLGHDWAWHAYVAPAGEPALGPTGFPHRISAAENPQAPLGHHQEDSTHISFGVVTLGASSRHVRLEASLFNGREPDQERWDFDFGPLDSYSARVSVNMTPSWSLQASTGHLEEPDEMMPGMDAKRTTFSVHHARSWKDAWVATSLIWGRNQHDGEKAQQAVTIETTLSRGKNSGYLRAEWIDRADLPGLMMGEKVKVGAFTLGYVRDLLVNRTGRWGLGGHVTWHDVPDELEMDYGSSPVSYHVFGRWRPPRVLPGGASAHERM